MSFDSRALMAMILQDGTRIYINDYEVAFAALDRLQGSQHVIKDYDLDLPPPAPPLLEASFASSKQTICLADLIQLAFDGSEATESTHEVDECTASAYSVEVSTQTERISPSAVNMETQTLSDQERLEPALATGPQLNDDPMSSNTTAEGPHSECENLPADASDVATIAEKPRKASKSRKKKKKDRSQSDDQSRIGTLDEYHQFLAQRKDLTLASLHDICNSHTNQICKPIPPEVLNTSPTMTSKRAIGKYGHTTSYLKQPSSWNLAIDDIRYPKPGALVLADCPIGSIPGCSLGVVVQLLEAHLLQVVFEPKSGGERQCLVIPLECICVPAQHR